MKEVRRGPYLGVEVATHSLLGPGLEVELCPALLLRVGHHVSHGLDRKHRPGFRLGFVFFPHQV